MSSKTERRVELALNTACTMPYDVATEIPAIAAAGFTSVELRIPELRDHLREHSLQDLSSLLKSHGLRVASINALEFVTFRGDDYAQVRGECDEVCTWAAELDCPMVIAVPSPTPTWQTAWSEVKAESASVLRDLASIAEPHGVTVGFEPLGFGWCSVRTVAGAAEILAEAEAPNLAEVIDLCHFHLGGSTLSEIDGLDPAYLPIVHVDDVPDGPHEASTDADRVFPGDGSLPIGPICERLRDIGFSGTLSVEVFRPEYWQLPVDEISRRAYAATAALADAFFSRVD
jgi:2-keto-myo-inositol isomerase